MSGEEGFFTVGGAGMGWWVVYLCAMYEGGHYRGAGCEIYGIVLSLFSVY